MERYRNDRRGLHDGFSRLDSVPSATVGLAWNSGGADSSLHRAIDGDAAVMTCEGGIATASTPGREAAGGRGVLDRHELEDIGGTEVNVTAGGTTYHIDLTGTPYNAANPITVYTPLDTGTDYSGHGTPVTSGLSVAAALAQSGSTLVFDTARSRCRPGR
jgi:hypothetical protein